MAKIYVSYDGSNLKLSDNGHTNAGRGEVIHWLKSDGVVAVTNVSAKSSSPTSTEVFWKEAPHDNGINFKGKINSKLADDKTWDWEYDITCKVGDPKNPNTVTEDPRIEVLPT